MKPRCLVSGLRRFQGWVERRSCRLAIGSLIWRLRHLWQRSWADAYVGSAGHPHRDQIVDRILAFGTVDSVLEVGCATGANLVRLHERSPAVRLYGIDISLAAIRAGRRVSQSQGKEVRMLVGSGESLRDLPARSVDVVFSDAVLMFLPPATVERTLRGMLHLCRKGLILNEYCQIGRASRFEDGRWIHDYPAVIHAISPTVKVAVGPSAFTGGLWSTVGALIEVRS